MSRRGLRGLRRHPGGGGVVLGLDACVLSGAAPVPAGGGALAAAQGPAQAMDRPVWSAHRSPVPAAPCPIGWQRNPSATDIIPESPSAHVPARPPAPEARRVVRAGHRVACISNFRFARLEPALLGHRHRAQHQNRHRQRHHLLLPADARPSPAGFEALSLPRFT